jgi:hypothetical protein
LRAAPAAPVFMRTFLTPEKMFGPVYRYRIDWNPAVGAPADQAAPALPTPQK